MSSSSLAASLLLLTSLLLSQALGIRLEKGFISVRQQNDNIQVEETGSIKRSNVAGSRESISVCKNSGECSSSGSTRKLISMTSSGTTTTTTTTSKNEKNNERNNRAIPKPKGKRVNTTQLGGEDGNVKAKPSAVSKHQEAVGHQHYLDLIDMTEMDYSPARRKPPTHN